MAARLSFKPHKYQQLAINKIQTQRSVGLFLDMGLGKTVITLTAISNLIALEEVKKVLVIAPLATARNTWSDEIAKWEHLDGLTISLVLGSADERRAALSADTDVYVINRENVQWLCENLSEWRFDMVVIDELSSFKNPSAKRFKALRKQMPFAKRVVGLTGTPAPNSYLDLWSQVYLLDKGERLGKTVGSYRLKYFDPGRRNGYIVYDWSLKSGAKELIDDKLSDLCISMKAVDFLDMPKRVETEIFVSMDDKERKIYDNFGKAHVLPELEVIGLTAASVQNKLLQLANGFVYDEEGTAHRIHDKKIEAVSEIVEAAQGRPVLVFYNFVADRDALLESIPGAKVFDGKSDVADWNNGKIPVLLAHPASAGHGLNLQAGGNIIVWYGLPWSLELYQQANARLYRQGQTKSVYIYHVLTKDTHDSDVLEALKKKDFTQESLLKALKARMEMFIK